MCECLCFSVVCITFCVTGSHAHKRFTRTPTRKRRSRAAFWLAWSSSCWYVGVIGVAQVGVTSFVWLRLVRISHMARDCDSVSYGVVTRDVMPCYADLVCRQKQGSRQVLDATVRDDPWNRQAPRRNFAVSRGLWCCEVVACKGALIYARPAMGDRQFGAAGRECVSE